MSTTQLALLVGWTVLEPMAEQIRTKKGERRGRYRDHTPSPQEVQAVVDRMRRSPTRLALLLAWRTGGRIGELATLRWAYPRRTIPRAQARARSRTGAMTSRRPATRWVSGLRWFARHTKPLARATTSHRGSGTSHRSSPQGCGGAAQAKRVVAIGRKPSWA